MKRVKLLIFTILISLSGYSQKQFEKKELSETISEIMNKYVDSLETKKFGIGALIHRKDETELYAIGYAGDSLKMTTDKIFNIGSLTKTFTAVLIMQEIENEQLKLTDSLGNFFPENLNYNVDLSITIEQLLTHFSGLGEIIVAQEISEIVENPYNNKNFEFLFNVIPEPKYLAGEKYQYTNTNYILLGYILEFINDLSYDELLREKIFKPAEMLNSYSYYSAFRENSAHPMYDGRDISDFTYSNYYRKFSYSAGGIASNLNDLEKFFINLYEKETFLKKETFAQMISNENWYGFGIMKMKFRTENKELIEVLGHGGDNWGFKTRNFYNPKNGNLVISFSNQFGDKYSEDIAQEILKAVE